MPAQAITRVATASGEDEFATSLIGGARMNSVAMTLPPTAPSDRTANHSRARAHSTVAPADTATVAAVAVGVRVAAAATVAT